MKDLKDKITDAALRLAARQPWDSVSLGDLAREADMTLAQLRGVIDDKDAIMGLLHARLDESMLAATVFEGTAKDRLFDLFMARFDAMNVHRDAYLSLFNAAKTQPVVLLKALPNLASSMDWALNAAGVETQGFKAEAAKIVLSVLFINALRAWINDETQDLSAVMAKLDQGLDRICRYI